MPNITGIARTPNFPTERNFSDSARQLAGGWHIIDDGGQRFPIVLGRKLLDKQISRWLQIADGSGWERSTKVLDVVLAGSTVCFWRLKIWFGLHLII